MAKRDGVVDPSGTLSAQRCKTQLRTQANVYRTKNRSNESQAKNTLG